MSKYPIVIDTLGKMREHREGLSVHCHTHLCWNRQVLDLDALIRLLGPDHGCSHNALIRRLYCARCREAGRPDRNIGFVSHVDKRTSVTREQDRQAALNTTRTD